MGVRARSRQKTYVIVCLWRLKKDANVICSLKLVHVKVFVRVTASGNLLTNVIISLRRMQNSAYENGFHDNWGLARTGRCFDF